MTGSTEGVGDGTACGGVTAHGRLRVKDVGLDFPHMLRRGSIGLMIWTQWDPQRGKELSSERAAIERGSAARLGARQAESNWIAWEEDLGADGECVRSPSVGAGKGYWSVCGPDADSGIGTECSYERGGGPERDCGYCVWTNTGAEVVKIWQG